MKWNFLRLLCCSLCLLTSLKGGGGQESWNTYREYIVKARCQAHCNEQYGEQRNATISEDFEEIYRPYECGRSHLTCSQCSQPCNKALGTLQECKDSCDNPVCKASCEFYYKVKNEEELSEDPVMSVAESLHLQQPVVVCRYSDPPVNGSSPPLNASMVYLRWNLRDFRSWSSLATHDVTASDRHDVSLGGSTRVALAFVISTKQRLGATETPWHTVGETNFSLIPVKGLTAGTDYKFRVTAVSARGLVDAAQETPWVATPPRLKPQKPLRVELAGQTVDQDKVRAVLRWTPSEAGGCFFKIYLMASHKGTYRGQDIRDRSEQAYVFKDLDFDSNYTIQVHTFDRTFEQSSLPTSLQFTSLPCLASTNHNYHICPPDPPWDFTFEEGRKYTRNGATFVNVTIHWRLPVNASTDNPVTAQQVNWRKYAPLSIAAVIPPHHGKTDLNGTQTSLVLERLHYDAVYDVTIRAISPGGESLPLATRLQLGKAYAEYYTQDNYDLLRISDGYVPPDDPRRIPLEEQTSQRDQTEGPDRRIYLLSLLPITLTLLGAVTVFFYRRHLRNKTRAVKINGQEELNPIYGSLMAETTCKMEEDFPSPDDYEVGLSCLEFEGTLGEGAFGRVMKARMFRAEAAADAEPRVVAVKTLKDHATPDERRSLLMEILAMKQLGPHQNLVSILACVTLGSQLCLVMDYCPLGDLRNYLRHYRDQWLKLRSCSRDRTRSTDTQQGMNSDSGISHNSQTSTSLYAPPIGLDPDGCLLSDDPLCKGLSESEDCSEPAISQTTLLSYARQIALGMEFLSENRYVHRDLAARNILMYNHRLLKISDLGLARDVYETNVYQPTSARKLPYKWMALESIFDQTFTTKSDVWSFGIVLWEIVTLGGSPYPGVPNKDLFRLLKDGYRMEMPDNCSPKIYQLMLACWHPDPDSRPSFTSLRLKLEALLEATCNYIDLSVAISDEYYKQDYSSSGSCSMMPHSQHSGSTAATVHSQAEVPYFTMQPLPQCQARRETGSCTGCPECAECRLLPPECPDMSPEEVSTTPPDSPLENVVFLPTVESEEPTTSSLSQDTSDTPFEGDLDDSDLDGSLSSCEHAASISLLKAPSLRYGMLGLLERMGRHNMAARQKQHRHSLSLTEVSRLGEEEEEDEPHHSRSRSSNRLAL